MIQLHPPEAEEDQSPLIRLMTLKPNHTNFQQPKKHIFTTIFCGCCAPTVPTLKTSPVLIPPRRRKSRNYSLAVERSLEELVSSFSKKVTEEVPSQINTPAFTDPLSFSETMNNSIQSSPRLFESPMSPPTKQPLEHQTTQGEDLVSFVELAIPVSTSKKDIDDYNVFTQKAAKLFGKLSERDKEITQPGIRQPGINPFERGQVALKPFLNAANIAYQEAQRQQQSASPSPNQIFCCPSLCNK